MNKSEKQEYLECYKLSINCLDEARGAMYKASLAAGGGDKPDMSLMSKSDQFKAAVTVLLRAVKVSYSEITEDLQPGM